MHNCRPITRNCRQSLANVRIPVVDFQFLLPMSDSRSHVPERVKINPNYFHAAVNQLVAGRAAVVTPRPKRYA